MFTFQTSGTCSKLIVIEVDKNNKLHGVKFIGGCSGNLQGVGKLVEGRDIDEVQTLLAGIKCRNNTSCPDQLSKAIAAYKKYVAEQENK